MTERARVIGGGRAGTAMAGALGRRGWHVDGPWGRSDDPTGAARDVDLVVIATPDGVIAEVAAAIDPDDGAVVAHLSGATTLDALGPHPRRASIHPLMAIPHGEAGIARLCDGGWFAVAGDPVATRVVEALGGRLVTVADEHRVRYHAAASIASNHLVALLGQVERLAASIDVPLEAYLDLASGALGSVGDVGPAAALTGPAARGDHQTLRAHIGALPVDERAAYVAMMRAAQRLAPHAGAPPTSAAADEPSRERAAPTDETHDEAADRRGDRR